MVNLPVAQGPGAALVSSAGAFAGQHAHRDFGEPQHGWSARKPRSQDLDDLVVPFRFDHRLARTARCDS